MEVLFEIYNFHTLCYDTLAQYILRDDYEPKQCVLGKKYVSEMQDAELKLSHNIQSY